MNNFWLKLNKKCKEEKRPILVLAPMAGITDSAFRQICKSYGADVVYSEMASVNALSYLSEKTLELLKFKKNERPYVVQLFGSDPENFIKAVKIVEKKIKPDGIDINFGCPVPKVAKQKAGAELFKDLKQSKEVIKAVIDNTALPVSIKIRKKVGSIDTLKFLDNISDLKISAVMIHGRSFSQGHSGLVDFDIIKKARGYFGGIIIANGGVKDAESTQELFEKTKADGIAIGQGALGRPWLFEQVKSQKSIKPKVSNEEIFKVALRHAKLAEKLKGKQGIIEMRKHLCWYVQGLAGAKKLREKLVRVEMIDDIKNVLK